MSEPKVSVCMVTYNHERFIAQALDSVLSQKADFPFEIVVGEDWSKDGTRAIVEEYGRRRPDVIRVLPNDRNLGIHANFLRTLFACRAPYVAMLEGDDYWIDDQKLARQVAFLEAHPNYYGCATPVREVHDDGQEFLYPRGCPDDVTLEYLLTINPFHTSSVMYRRVFPPLPEWYATITPGDWPLHLLHALRGPFRLLPGVSACYRVHARGFWSGRGETARFEQAIEALGIVRADLPASTHDRLDRTIATFRAKVVYLKALAGDRRAVAEGLRALCADPRMRRFAPKWLLAQARIGYVSPMCLRGLVALQTWLGRLLRGGGRYA